VDIGAAESTPGLRQAGRSLREWLVTASRIAVVGIGGQLQEDDAIGARIAQRLLDKTGNNVRVLVCWTVPESCTGPIRQFDPSHVLLIDAAQLGQLPGAVQLIDPGSLLGLSISTHSMPLKLLVLYLSKATRAQIALLAVQPRDTGLGERLSPPLESAAQDLSTMLLTVLPH
jgi:hydrogenase 3 maturation protease